MRVARFWIQVSLIFLLWSVTSGNTCIAGCLEISDGGSGKALMAVHIEDRTVIQLEFINSIYLAPVKETFIYKHDEGIYITGVESPSAGVFEYYRLEEVLQGRAQLYRHIGEIRLRTSDYKNHKLTVGGQLIPLKGLAINGELLIIRVNNTRKCEVERGQ